MLMNDIIDRCYSSTVRFRVKVRLVVLLVHALLRLLLRLLIGGLGLVVLLSRRALVGTVRRWLHLLQLLHFYGRV